MEVLSWIGSDIKKVNGSTFFQLTDSQEGSTLSKLVCFRMSMKQNLYPLKSEQLPAMNHRLH